MRSVSLRRVRVIASLLAALLLLGIVPALAAPPSGASPADFDAAFAADGVVEGQLLVTTTTANDDSFAAGASVSATRVADRVQAVSVEAGTEAAEAARIAAQPGVAAVSPVYASDFSLSPNDARYPEEWSHTRTNTEAGWDIDTGSGDVAIWQADSGINAGHPDLADRVAGQFRVDGETVVEGTSGNNDSSGAGHGTLVAGVLGASTDNEIGVAGVDWAAGVFDIDLAQDGGGFTTLQVAAAVAFAADNGADVINLSLGTIQPTPCDDATQAVMDQANEAGAVVVAASGNSQQEFPGENFSPANCDGVISVAASTNSDSVTSYSSQNEFVDLAAPGGDIDPDNPPADEDELIAQLILSTRNPEAAQPPILTDGEEYDVTLGTSFAAPYVSGVAGLLRSVNPDLSTAEIAGILTSTAVHPDGVDRDDALGAGIVNVAAALEAAGGEEPEPRDERRIYGDDIDNTDVAQQAVAASQEVFGDGEATHVVLTRGDEYADALAGSTLTLGTAPVLYTGSTGPLPTATSDEIARVVPEGGLVLVLGGEAAVPAEAEAEVAAAGFETERVAGPSRGETAEAAAGKVVELLDGAEGVILAKAFDWPDAITAGSLGVQYDFPVLLTGYGEDQVDELHPSAARAIEAIEPDTLITVGGAGAVGEEAEREAADIGGVPEENIIRLGGGSRLETAVEVADFLDTNLDVEGRVAYGVNVRAADGYAHVLSTSANVAATGGFYIPFEGEDGSRYLDDDTTFVREYVQSLDEVDGRVVGGRDVIVDEALEAFFDDLSVE